MDFFNMTACWVVCGSFCSFEQSFRCAEELVRRKMNLIPVVSYVCAITDSRFGKAADLMERIERICGRPVIRTIEEAEPLGPKIATDLAIISPCTGNTLAKLAAGITDTPAAMAVKATMRSEKPVVVALASNDALAANLKNIAAMLNRKKVFFVPMTQDDPQKKPHSLVADFALLPQSVEAALAGDQIRPVFR